MNGVLGVMVEKNIWGVLGQDERMRTWKSKGTHNLVFATFSKLLEPELKRIFRQNLNESLELPSPNNFFLCIQAKYRPYWVTIGDFEFLKRPWLNEEMYYLSEQIKAIEMGWG